MVGRVISPKHKRPKYTHEDIQEAVRKFQKAGGLIKRLPDEKVLAGLLIVPRYDNNSPDYDSVGPDLS